jgi:hypothetical protein
MDMLIKLFGILTSICLFANCSNAPTKDLKIDVEKAEQYIRESEKQWASSVSSGDTTVIQRILADDFIGVDPEGNQYNKQQMFHDT